MTKAIIFDLGGVIIDLGFDEMVKKFDQLGIKNFGDAFNPLRQIDFFEQLELGSISSEEFYKKFRKNFLTDLSNDQIEATWNLIIKDFKIERMLLLEKLAQNHPLYLFSNTNAIHARYFEKNCLNQLGKPLSHYFHETFYSHELHLRKPEPAAFKEVLRRAKLQAEETLFIDDNHENILGAKSVGLQTYHLKFPEDLLDINFKNIFSHEKSNIDNYQII